MKYLLLILISTPLFFSCKKEDRPQNIVPIIEEPYYAGRYNAVNGDTLYVSKSSDSTNYVNFRWKPTGGINDIVFDSVVVSSDSSFVVNQKIDHPDYTDAIGTGRFSSNTVQFHFTLDVTNHIIYSGIKH